MTNHPLATHVKEPFNSQNAKWAYLFLSFCVWNIIKENKVLSNPIALSPSSLKNYKKYYKWFLDKEIYSEKEVLKEIEEIAEDVDTPEQMDIILKLKRTLWYHHVFSEGYRKYYGMDIPLNLRWEAFKKLSEFVIKNWRVDGQKVLYWRNVNRDFSYFQQRYVSLTREFDLIQRDFIQATLHELEHFIDLMKDEPERYRALKRIRFIEPIFRLADELNTLHDEINKLETKGFFKSVPTPSKDFIVINKDLKWVFIDESYCPFEQEAMGHCARARSGCKLLSLRELSDVTNAGVRIAEKIWIPRVTATLCKPGWGKDKYEDFDVYEVEEILGPENEEPEKIWEEAILRLFLDKRIVDYNERSANSYSPIKLSDQNQKLLYKKKPDMAPPSYILKHGTKKQFLKFLSENLDRVDLDSLKIYDDHILVFEHEDLHEFIKESPPYNFRLQDANIKNLDEAYNDPFYFTESMDFVRFEDIDYKLYLESMDEKLLKKAFFNQNIDISEIDRKDLPESLKDIIYEAEHEGWNAGTQKAISSEAFNILSEITWNGYDVMDTAFVDFNNGKWHLWLNYKNAKEQSLLSLDRDRDISDDLFHEINVGELRWESDFDPDAAMERFKELTIEQYGE